MLTILEHGVTLTATTMTVLVVAIPLSPIAADIVDASRMTVAHITKLDYGVHQHHQLQVLCNYHQIALFYSYNLLYMRST